MRQVITLAVLGVMMILGGVWKLHRYEDLPRNSWESFRRDVSRTMAKFWIGLGVAALIGLYAVLFGGFDQPRIQRPVNRTVHRRPAPRSSSSGTHQEPE